MRSKGDDIADRLLDLGAFVLRIGPVLKERGVPNRVIQQLQSSGTSPGANYAEARGGESRKDFIHKLRIALKELRETRYWLRLLVRAGYLERTEKVVRILDETNQLVAILTASTHTAMANTERGQKR